MIYHYLDKKGNGYVSVGLSPVHLNNNILVSYVNKPLWP